MFSESGNAARQAIASEPAHSISPTRSPTWMLTMAEAARRAWLWIYHTALGLWLVWRMRREMGRR